MLWYHIIHLTPLTFVVPSQCRHQEPSHLQHGRIPPFLPFHPGSIYRGQNHSRPSGCCRCPHGCVAAHKHLPGRSHYQPSRHLRILATTRASLLPATSDPNAWPSKGASTHEPPRVVSPSPSTPAHPLVAIPPWIYITYSGPSTFPRYTPTPRLCRHPFSKGRVFTSMAIA